MKAEKLPIRQYTPFATLIQYGQHITAICLFLLFWLAPAICRAGEDPPYEEILVSVGLPQAGATEMPALISDETLYLPVTDLFNFLKIDHHLSAGRDSVSGFFIDSKVKYLVDKKASRIILDEKNFDLDLDALISTETNLYLRSDWFGKIFQLNCTFHFRSLSVLLDTKLEIPVISEMRQELLRQNIKKFKGEVKADTVIRRRYPFFQMGMADWAVAATEQSHNITEARLNLRLGAMLAGGEANVSLNYDNKIPAAANQQYYQWRYINNSWNALRQISVGNIAAQATASIFKPVVGMLLSNTPTTRRKSFGTYTLSDHTEPGWMVELYVNNILVDYVQADASGFFTFEVPLIYGNTMMKLRFYGPSGEERSDEQTVNIPFNFLPPQILEYIISAGMVEDTLNSRFSRVVLNYGLSRNITIGSGLEYLSSVSTGKSMPFLNTTVRMGANLLLSGEFTYGVRSKAILTYRRPSQLQVELNYIKYAKGQKAIQNNFLEERKATLSMPLLVAKHRLLSRFSLTQAITPTIDYASLLTTKYSDILKHTYTSANFMLSGSVGKWNANLTTSGQFSDAAAPAIYNNLSLAYRFSNSLIFRSQMQYDDTKAQLINTSWEVEKRLRGNGMLNISYEKNWSLHTGSFTAGLRYDFSFMRTAFSANRNNKATTLVQSANGSLLYDGKTNYIKAGNRTGVGRGGLTIVSFLDINCNGKRDAKEPLVPGVRLHVNGGRTVLDRGDGIIRIADLEPYVNYIVKLDGNSLGNIAWQIKKKVLSVAVDPNVFKLIEVPVAVLGEASGMVYLQKEQHQDGLSRIHINFYDSSSRIVAQILSESDGYFSYLGLPPGQYTARIDTAQLHLLNLTCSPQSLSFTIAGSEEGTIADGFAFILQSLSQPEEQQPAKQTKLQPEIVKKQQPILQPAQPATQGLVQPVGEHQPALAQKPSVMTGQNNRQKQLSDEKPEMLESKKRQPIATQKRDTGLQKHSYAVKQKIAQPVKKKSPVVSKSNIERTITRQQLLAKQQQLNKKHQQAVQKVQQLITQQQELLKKQQELIKEIRHLKLQLLLKKAKEVMPSSSAM